MSSAEISIMVIMFMMEETDETEKGKTETHCAKAADNSFTSPKGNL